MLSRISKITHRGIVVLLHLALQHMLSIMQANHLVGEEKEENSEENYLSPLFFKYGVNYEVHKISFKTFLVCRL